MNKKLKIPQIKVFKLLSSTIQERKPQKTNTDIHEIPVMTDTLAYVSTKMIAVFHETLVRC